MAAFSFRRWRVLLLATLAGCSSSAPSADAGKGPLQPEQRFGNDTELVADFSNVKQCVYREGRLDHSCKELSTLQQRIATKSRRPATRSKVVTTLANLLESRRELTRLVAADNLFLHHQDPQIVAAMQRALPLEVIPNVKATLLRQSCWKVTPWARRTALELLAPREHDLVQAEAAICLGRMGRDSTSRDTVIQALVAATARDRTAAVRGNACAALGAVGAGEAVKTMAPLLDDPALDWRCGSALAQVGTEDAYQALSRGVARALARDRMPVQHVTALTSFVGKPFFRRSPTARLLRDIGARRTLSWIARKRAVEELIRLEATTELKHLQALYAKEHGAGDDAVIRALQGQPPKTKPRK